MTYAPDTLAPARAWIDAAACRTADPEIFHGGGGDVITAKEICELCPVRLECLADALAAERGYNRRLRHGVFGGKSPRERADMDRSPKRSGRPLAPCGTDAAYVRHVRAMEPIDDACAAAHARENERRVRRAISRKAAA